MKNLFSDLYETIELRKKSNKKIHILKSCSKKEKKIAQKFGEESVELIIDFLKGSKKRTIEESIDVLYHPVCFALSKKN